jgi:hypothetical protein
VDLHHLAHGVERRHQVWKIYDPADRRIIYRPA